MGLLNKFLKLFDSLFWSLHFINLLLFIKIYLNKFIMENRKKSLYKL